MSLSTNAQAVSDSLSLEVGISPTALKKKTGLSDIQMTLAIAELGGGVRVEEGLLYKQSTEAGTRGSRGQTKKCAARTASLSAFVNELIAAGGEFNAKSIMAVAADRWVYTDIAFVMDPLVASGKVIESKIGRTRTWKGAPVTETVTTTE